MDICATTPWNISGWQAGISFKTNFKNVLLSFFNGTVAVHTDAPETPTTEAVCLIIVILVFVIFSVLGTFINVYEVFCENNAKGMKANGEAEKKTVSSKPEEQERKVWLKGMKFFLTCFCVVKNGKKIFQADSGKEQFNCIHGIRSFSSIYLIVLHTFSFYMFTINNMETVKPWVTHWTSQFMLNAVLVIDGFFAMSGFLNGFIFCMEYTKSKGEFSFSIFYIKRFIRLTPVYMVVYGVHTVLLSSRCAYSLESSALHSVCKESWWWHLLYINNFQTPLKQCMVWCWQLALDMQFYIISPIFLILLIKLPTLGYSFASLCIFLSCFASFVISKHCSLTDGATRFGFHTQDTGAFIYRLTVYVEKVYSLPYTRIGSYLVGLLLGYYIYKIKKDGKDTRHSRVTLFCGWIVSIVLMLGTFFAMYNRKESIFENAVYNGVKGLLYSVGFVWPIYVCVNGQGGLLNRLLSSKALIPFSNLSYCSYLIHMVIILKFYHDAPDTEELPPLSVICRYLWVHIWTLVFSLPTSLLFELPMGNLIVLFRKRKLIRQKVN